MACGAIQFLVLALLCPTSLADAAKPVGFVCKTRDPRCAMRSDLTWWCHEEGVSPLPNPRDLAGSMVCGKTAFRNVGILSNKTGFTRYPHIVSFACGRSYLHRLSKMSPFQGQHMTTDLCFGHMAEMQLDIFEGSHGLKLLDLEENDIEIIPRGLFWFLPSLRSASLANNKISALHAHAFEGLDKLTVLDLRSNRISYIDRSAFKGLTGLTHLHLDQNDLSAFESGTFDDLENLQVLTLSQNQIRKWPDLQAAAKGLQTLSLDFNKISALSDGPSSELKELKYFTIEGNLLCMVSDGFFNATPSLVSLDLGKNKLKTIDPNAFRGLRNLKSLVLRGNNISSPYVEWIAHAKEEPDVYLDAGDNEWECNCETLKFQMFVNDLKEAGKARTENIIFDANCSFAGEVTIESCGLAVVSKPLASTGDATKAALPPIALVLIVVVVTVGALWRRRRSRFAAGEETKYPGEQERVVLQEVTYQYEGGSCGKDEEDVLVSGGSVTLLPPYTMPNRPNVRVSGNCEWHYTPAQDENRNDSPGSFPQELFPAPSDSPSSTSEFFVEQRVSMYEFSSASSWEAPNSVDSGIKLSDSSPSGSP